MGHSHELTYTKDITFDAHYKELRPLGLLAVLLNWHSNRLVEFATLLQQFLN